MDKKELLIAMQTSREALSGAIAGLSDDELQTPGVNGEWSVKDILSHLSMWEAELVSLLFMINNGEKPDGFFTSNRSDDDINAEWYQELKDRPLERVQADFLGVRRQTIKQIENLDGKALQEDARFPPLKHPLIEIIRNNTYTHEDGHRQSIETWRKDNNK